MLEKIFLKERVTVLPSVQGNFANKWATCKV